MHSHIKIVGESEMCCVVFVVFGMWGIVILGLVVLLTPVVIGFHTESSEVSKSETINDIWPSEEFTGCVYSTGQYFDSYCRRIAIGAVGPLVDQLYEVR